MTTAHLEEDCIVADDSDRLYRCGRALAFVNKVAEQLRVCHECCAEALHAAARCGAAAGDSVSSTSAQAFGAGGFKSNTPKDAATEQRCVEHCRRCCAEFKVQCATQCADDERQADSATQPQVQAPSAAHLPGKAAERSAIASGDELCILDQLRQQQEDEGNGRHIHKPLRYCVP